MTPSIGANKRAHTPVLERLKDENRSHVRSHPGSQNIDEIVNLTLSHFTQNAVTKNRGPRSRPYNSGPPYQIDWSSTGFFNPAAALFSVAGALSLTPYSSVTTAGRGA